MILRYAQIKSDSTFRSLESSPSEGGTNTVIITNLYSGPLVALVQLTKFQGIFLQLLSPSARRKRAVKHIYSAPPGHVRLLTN